MAAVVRARRRSKQPGRGLNVSSGLAAVGRTALVVLLNLVGAMPSRITWSLPVHGAWAHAPGRGEAQGQGVSCVAVRSEARYGAYGYDHLVHLANHCAQAVTCSVSTNVRIEALNVRLERQESTTLVTYRGSPAREFRASVICVADVAEPPHE